MKRTLVYFSLAILLIVTVGCNRYSESVWQDKYNLGERYLLEENYEQAAIVFEELIEIDPMRPEGYAKTAEAYIALERFDDAQDIIQLGFEQTEDVYLDPEQLYSNLYQHWADNVWQKNYELGMQYLEEDNYQLAQNCFTRMISIYTDRSEGYEKAAETYLMMNDYQSAEQILTEGFEKTQDYSLKPDILIEEWAYKWAYDDLLRPEEITISGIPFYELTFEDVLSLYPGGELNSSDPTKQRVYKIDNLKFLQESSYEHLHSFYIDSAEDSLSGQVVYHPEFRDLYIGENITDFLTKLGFTQSGIQYILNSNDVETQRFGLPLNYYGGERSASWGNVLWGPYFSFTLYYRISSDLSCIVSFKLLNEQINSVHVWMQSIDMELVVWPG